MACEPSVQNRLIPLDSRLFTTLHYTSFQSAPFTIGRLAVALTVMIDNLLTAIADCQPSICLSRLLPRYNFEKMNEEIALKKILDNVSNSQSLAGQNNL